MLWPIIGADYRPITDCLVQDASLFNKSYVVTIVKSQWYDGRFVTLLLQFHFVVFSYGQPIPVFSGLCKINKLQHHGNSKISLAQTVPES